MSEQSKCQVCGEPMPEGEQMFTYHGYSGPCPKPSRAEALAETERVEAYGVQVAAFDAARDAELNAAIDRLSRWERAGCYPGVDHQLIRQDLRIVLSALADEGEA